MLNFPILINPTCKVQHIICVRVYIILNHSIGIFATLFLIISNNLIQYYLLTLWFIRNMLKKSKIYYTIIILLFNSEILKKCLWHWIWPKGS